MIKLVFATSNQNKVIEIDNLLPETIQLSSLKELGHKRKSLKPQKQLRVMPYKKPTL